MMTCGTSAFYRRMGEPDRSSLLLMAGDAEGISLAHQEGLMFRTVGVVTRIAHSLPKGHMILVTARFQVSQFVTHCAKLTS